MPTTPQVNFNFKNENVQASVPQLGVAHFLARTTKGLFNDPSEVISSPAQFHRLFGDEVVPDGSVSNILKALEIGSKVRVSRVAGADASYGYAQEVDPEEETPTDKVFSMVLTSALDSTKTVTLSFKLRSKEQGTQFNDAFDNIYLKFTKDTSGPRTKIILTQAYSDTFSDDSIIDSRVFIAWNDSSKSIDFKALRDFVDQAPNVTVEVNGTFDSQTLDIYGVIAWMSSHVNYLPAVSFVTTDLFDLSKGSDGGVSTVETWKAAYEAMADYNDAYDLVLSHVHQHLPDDYEEVYQEIAPLVTKHQEEKIWVELPKPQAGTTLTNYLNSLKTLVNAVGQSKFICYAGGGIKYYDQLGIIRDCDVLGSVVGLHSVSASNYGPWYSPAGQNRGIIIDALGPVMKNLGTPSQIESLQEFADWYLNLFVIKDTQYTGKRTMLWHNFTSNPLNDSEKFISIVNLNLYIKKNIRPILESYLEEPNTFSTWKNIYYQVKPILDDLITRNAMTEYEWLGDQNAQTYSDLQINNEADVRQGKYKVKLTYKDIVTLQDISLDVIISKADKSVSITLE